MSPQPAAVQLQTAVAGGSFAELAVFMKEQQALLLAQQTLLLEQQKETRQEMEARQKATEAKAKADLDKLREEMTPRELPPAISDAELTALQARFESLHAAQLLTDEELYASEDLCADYLELLSSVPNGGALTEDAIFRGVGESYQAAAKLHKLARLSSGMASDAAFSRQLKRKFL